MMAGMACFFGWSAPRRLTGRMADASSSTRVKPEQTRMGNLRGMSPRLSETRLAEAGLGETGLHCLSYGPTEASRRSHFMPVRALFGMALAGLLFLAPATWAGETSKPAVLLRLKALEELIGDLRFLVKEVG